SISARSTNCCGAARRSRPSGPTGPCDRTPRWWRPGTPSRRARSSSQVHPDLGGAVGGGADVALAVAVGDEFGEGGAVGESPVAVVVLAGEPGTGFGGGEPADLELGQTAARPDDGGVQPGQVLVGGDGDEHLAALAEHAVGEIEQAREF